MIYVQRNLPSWRSSHGRVHLAAGGLDAAEQVLRRQVQVDPAGIDGYRLLGRVYAAAGRLDAAQAEFDRIARERPNEVWPRIMGTLIAHEQQNVAEAKVRYADILEREPRAAIAANNLAWIYAQEGANLDLALSLAQSAADQFPDHPDITYTIGWIYYRKGVPAMAIPPFDHSVRRGPGDATHRYHLGLAYAATGDQDAAKGPAQRAVALAPSFADAQRLLLDALPR